MAICRSRERKISIQEEDVRRGSEIRAIQYTRMPGIDELNEDDPSMKRTKLLAWEFVAIVIGRSAYKKKMYG